jgi:phosphoenolpyruvate phosphomutase / 2-hydroxyethylphosphonate cytidylyltransferase|tara:strand:- start:12225 stop:13523 length:1299 start_codon:yes stop_codon:yes gene_type:complete
MKNKIVYVCFSDDILHEGHYNILKKASSLGKVTVGLLTDKAIATYRTLPYNDYKQRELAIKNIRYVDRVLMQDTLDYSNNLRLIRPDFVVHGDNWKKGIQKNIRLKVIKVLKLWGGKLIEFPYTKKISYSKVKEKIIETGTTPDIRKSKLKRLINAKKIVRVLESHSALSGLIIENLKIINKSKNFLEFDCMWSSSLTDSTLRGKPDNQSVDISSRINGLNDILEVTTKPVIFDGDNGGRIEHIKYTVKSLERSGVSAIAIEDKKGLKKNSLFKNQKGVSQDSIKDFCKKIKAAKSATVSKDFMIIARIESLILGKSVSDALSRANAYSKAGADAILIHSKEKTPLEIFQFTKKWIKSKNYKPIVVVPSTYSKTTEEQLIKNGVKIVIYANHLLRASYPSMVETAKTILLNKRSSPVEKKITPIKEILTLIN